MRTIITALLLTASTQAIAEDPYEDRGNAGEAFVGLMYSPGASGAGFGIRYWAAEEFALNGDIMIGVKPQTDDPWSSGSNKPLTMLTVGGMLNAPARVNENVTVDMFRAHVDVAHVPSVGTGLMLGAGLGGRSRGVSFSTKGSWGNIQGQQVARATFTIGALL